jgi:hypothetical protein
MGRVKGLGMLKSVEGRREQIAASTPVMIETHASTARPRTGLLSERLLTLIAVIWGELTGERILLS